jgi:hypothetical protein
MRHEWVQCKQNKLYAPKPVVSDMTVGAGKSLVIAMLAKHITDHGMKFLNLARAGELVQQNFDEAWAIGCKSSIYSASLKSKSQRYPAIYGTEGTVARAIVPSADFGVNAKTGKANWIPDVLAIDECFTGDTLITTSNGLVRIDQITTSDMVKCRDHDKNLDTFDRPVHIQCNGTKYVSHIYTSKGLLKCTKNHPIYSLDSKDYKSAESLRFGEMIAFESSSESVISKLFRASAAVVKELLLHLRRKKEG